jgi:hypothetical protein
MLHELFASVLRRSRKGDLHHYMDTTQYNGEVADINFSGKRAHVLFLILRSYKDASRIRQ